VAPVFTIGLHAKDLALLKSIREFFGVGEIYEKKDGFLVYSVTSLKEITNVIIPHFTKYILMSQKRVDFELFKQVVQIMNKGEHLTMAGFSKIVAIKAAMNLGLSESIKKAFSHVIPYIRPVLDNSGVIDPN